MSADMPLASAADADAAPAEAHIPWPKPLVAWYAVFMLSLANALSFVVRTILSLLVDPVRADLHVSDTAISLLQGASFATIFALIGLPAAWLADRTSRRTLIVGSIFVWSAMTAFCGLARSYPMLFLGRLGSGAGEGGFSPASGAIITDFFPRQRLPLAMAVYSLGIYIGIGSALILGGAIAQWALTAGQMTLPVLGLVKGWQLAFFLTALPGFVLALLFLTVPEPPRRNIPAKGKGAGISDLIAQFRALPWPYAGLMGGFALFVLGGTGAVTWIPAYLARTFGMSAGQVGAQYGVLTLVFGLAGSVFGGLTGNRMATAGRTNANAVIALVTYSLAAISAALFFFADTKLLTFVFAAGVSGFSASALACGFAAIQEITPNRLRAQVGAVFIFAINALGAGLGPTVVAMLSDQVFQGPHRLSDAIAATGLISGVPAAWLLWMAMRRYPKVLTSDGQPIVGAH